MLKPEFEVRLFAAEPFVHHQLVVADQRNEPAFGNEVDQSFDRLCGLHSPINVIANAYNGILLSWLDFTQKSLERCCASVNVTNCDRTGHR